MVANKLPGQIIGCEIRYKLSSTDGLDLKITNFEISDNDLTSGDVVNVDLDVEIVITGPNEGLPQKTWPDRNYDIRFDLSSSVHEPRLGNYQWFHSIIGITF